MYKFAGGAIPASFEYNYFVKDHLGNVRMVLTEEVKQDVYPVATLENVTYNGGTAISTPQTKAYGCTIKYSASR